MNYKTGEVLGMVSLPTFDPMSSSAVSASSNAYWNRVTQNPYTPGSTFKLVTAAAQLRGDLRDGDLPAGPSQHERDGVARDARTHHKYPRHDPHLPNANDLRLRVRQERPLMRVDRVSGRYPATNARESR